MEGKSIIFTGSKGGCGCSFISYSVATYYALHKEKNILLLDLCPGSFFSRVIFDLKEKKVKDWGDIKKDIGDIDLTLLKNLVINTGYSLNLIVPPVDSTGYSNLPDVVNLLEKLKEYFQLVVVDMPGCYLDFKGWNLMGHQDKISLISDPSLVSVKNLNRTAVQISDFKPCRVADLVINRYNVRPSLSPALINSYIHYPIKAFIPYDRDIENLFLNRGPNHIFKYNLRITKSIVNLAESIYGELEDV